MRQQIPEDIEEIAELAAMLGSTVNSYKGLADPRDPNSRKLFGNPVTPGEMVGSYMQGRKAGGPITEQIPQPEQSIQPIPPPPPVQTIQPPPPPPVKPLFEQPEFDFGEEVTPLSASDIEKILVNVLAKLEDMSVKINEIIITQSDIQQSISEYKQSGISHEPAKPSKKKSKSAPSDPKPPNQ